MQDLLSIGTNRRESMIGTGIGLGLAGYRLNPPGVLPVLDLRFSQDKSLTAFAGPTPSFSRASSGTYFDANGVLQSAGVNAARFNHVFNGTSWVSKGLLVEEQRTNSSPYSVTFNSGNAPWGMADLSISLNSATAPDGTNTATKIIEGTGTGNHNIYRVFPFSGTITWSIFAKAAERNYIQIFIGALNSPEAGINVDLTNGAITNQSPSVVASGTQDVGNGWYRIWFSVTGAGGTYYPAVSTSNSATGIRSSYTGNGTSGVYIWGAQWESGSFPTSYIVNSGNGSTTRSADVCQITGSDFSGFWNGTEGTIVLEQDLLSYSDPTADQRYFSVAGGANSPGLTLHYDGGSNFYWERYFNSASNLTLPDVSAGYKVAIAFKTNDYAAVLNGGNPVTAASPAFGTNFAKMDIGYQVSGAARSSHIARLRYYPVRLSNAKLQELST